MFIALLQWTAGRGLVEGMGLGWLCPCHGPTSG